MKEIKELQDVERVYSGLDWLRGSDIYRTCWTVFSRNRKCFEVASIALVCLSMPTHFSECHF